MSWHWPREKGELVPEDVGISSGRERGLPTPSCSIGSLSDVDADGLEDVSGPDGDEKD